ncbi:hypothetical protein SporoS204_09745 [Sporosarcina ureae]|uniref:Uncharacterized protein n=1 Tax=Sporosarcina ureae TaxID=1571 RepID=A0ABM6JVT9_SPOUR|nr:hypothetical protein SporoS204_09745 [Sporosarcina ureae]
MGLLKVEGIRYIIFCIIMLILTFVGFMSISAFFISCVSFIFLNYILAKRNFNNKEYGNVYFHLFYVVLTIFTIVLVNVQIGWVN